MPPPAAANEREWYGWQTLLIDGAGIATGIAASNAIDANPGKLGMTAGTWYGIGALGAPAVHYAHRRWYIGLADFGMRALAPPLIGFFGLLASCWSNHDSFEVSCARSGWGTGSLIGLVGASAVDALLLSRASNVSDSQPQKHWYGLPILAIDLVGYGVGIYFAATAKRQRDGERIHPALATWVMGYTIGFIGAPIVHFAHGRVGVGFISLGARLLIGPVGAVVGLMGFCAATAGSRDCAANGAQWGLLGGSIATALFDAMVLANEPAATAETPQLGLMFGPGSIALGGRW
jgi:hypothetical protein